MKNAIITILVIAIVAGAIVVVSMWPDQENQNQNTDVSNENINQAGTKTINGTLDIDTVILLDQEVNFDDGKIVISLVDLKQYPSTQQRNIVPRINVSGSAVTDQIFDFGYLMDRVYISTDIEGYRIILKSEDLDSATIYVQKPFSTEDDYVCADEIIDCMPIVPPENTQYCAKDYLEWARENCPGFGVTY